MEGWNPRPLDPGMIRLHRRGNGTPLVMLHCLGQSHRFWDVLSPLADIRELIAYSWPGHHDTPLPGHQYGVPELASQLRAVALREGLAKFDLMGISLGGTVAAHFAGEWPDMVGKLVLADCAPRYDDASRANWPVRAAIARAQGVRALVPMLMGVFFTERSLAEDGPDVRHVREIFHACSGEGYALACEALATCDARAQVARIRAPALIMLGSAEREMFQEAARWMNAAIPGSRVLEVPEAGHASIRHRPAFALAALREFLS